MKKNLYIALFFLLTLGAVRADLIWYEGYNYPNGRIDVVSTNLAGTVTNWIRHSGTVGDAIVTNHMQQVFATGSIVSRTDDVHRNFPTNYTGAKTQLFASMTLIVTNIPGGTNQGFFAHFLNSTSTFSGKLFCSGGTLPGTYRLGCSGAANAASVIFPVDLCTNIPYQVVFTFDPVTSFAAQLWVNPLGSSDTSVTSFDGVASTVILQSFAFRQASTFGNFASMITNLAAATTFDEAATNVWPTNAVAPKIVRQPVGLTNFTGSTFNLIAMANGQSLANMTYQWYQNGSPISNPNGNSNVLANLSAQVSDSGSYYLVATTPYGLSVTSSAVNVFISNAPVPPAITSQPTSTNLYVGQNVIFSVTVSSPGNVSYQWKSNGVNIPGANGQTYELDNVQTNYAAAYSVGVTNDVVTQGVVSSNAVLTVQAPSKVTIAFLRTLVDTNTYQATNVPPTIPYTITGVVTTYTNITTGNTASYYLQDGTAGINIFATFASTFRPQQGDVVQFTGVLSSFTSGLELFADTQNRTYTSYSIVSNNYPIPAGISIPFTATTNLSNCNYHLAESLVTLSDVYFGTNAGTTIPTNANATLTVTNSAGQTFNLFFVSLDQDTAGQTLPVHASTVTGLLYGGPAATNFSLLVTRYSDIVTNAPVVAVPITSVTSSGKIVLSWSNPAFTLQGAPTPKGSWTNIAGATSPYTNSTTSGTHFFRLAY